MNPNNPLHICMMSSLHSPYDDRIYWKQALSLHHAGYQVTHISIGDSDSDEISEHGIRLVQIRKSRFSGSLITDTFIRRLSPNNEYREMLRKARQIKADVYHLHDLQLLKIAGRIKALPHKPLLMYDVHEPYPITLADAEFKNPLMKWTMQLYARWIHHWELRKSKLFDLIITTEENVAGKFKDHLPQKPVEIIYNYCNWGLQPATYGTEKKYDFIYTGGIRRRRGALEMIQAVAMLRQQGIKVRLLMVGPVCDEGLQEELEQSIEKEALAKQVTLLQPVPYEQVTEFYKVSRCGLAFFDTKKVNHIIMPIKIFEYIAFGLPVICTGIGHMKRITETHRTGITVEPGNIDQLARTMTQLMKEEKLYNTLRQNCLNLYKSQFNWQQMERKLLALYDDLLSTRKQEMQPDKT